MRPLGRLAMAVVALVAVLAVATPAQAKGGLRVRILVPERGNMQYASFWVALGGDYFADAGYDVELVVPEAPHDVQTFWREHRTDLAVMPASMFTSALAEHGDVTILANLLVNDPTALVVRRSKLPPAGPIAERLEALHDVKIGVAPNPMNRFDMLYNAFGLDADRDATVVTIPGKEQNAAFHAGTVDALFAQSPFLERAIVQDDAVVVVAPSLGEVPPLTHHVIAAFVTRASMLDRQRPTTVGLVRALVRAAHVLHEAPNEAVASLAREFPDRDRRELETIVRLYAPAVPAAPGFPTSELPHSATIYAADRVPDLSKVDLTHVVAYDVMGSAEERPQKRHGRLVMIGAGLVILAMAVLGIVTKRRT